MVRSLIVAALAGAVAATLLLVILGNTGPLANVLLRIGQHSSRDKLLGPPLNHHDHLDQHAWLSNTTSLSEQQHWCDDPSYRKSTLKLIRELPFAGVFGDTRGVRKFEGSGMVAYPAIPNHYAIVFDNLNAVGIIGDRFQFRLPTNKLVGPLGEDSQFEGVAMMPENGHVLLLHEALEHDEGYLPEVKEVAMKDDLSGYEIISRCVVNLKLTHSNKGLEGMHYHWDGKEGYLLGLCEGNYCKGGEQGKERGNGRLIVFTRKDLSTRNGTMSSSHSSNDDTHDCEWNVYKVLQVPPTANFMDYSEMSVHASTNRMAITSQEDSALWIGTFDFDSFEFAGEGEVYTFPLDNHCRQIYCNVEGVEFVDDNRIIVASDKAKRYQPHECVARDQSIHVFALP